MAAGSLASRHFGLFGDEVFSSKDLHRRSSEVLDRARKHPVTINRNSEHFALLRRDQAARLVRTSDRFGPIVELVSAAINVVENREPPASLVWIKAFSLNDLRAMIREVLVACDLALKETGDWEAVDIIVHQWQETALVTMSGVLKHAIESAAEESPLTDPALIPEPTPDAELELVSATNG